MSPKAKKEKGKNEQQLAVASAPQRSEEEEEEEDNGIDVKTGRFDRIHPGKVRKTKGFTKAFAKLTADPALQKRGRPILILGMLYFEDPNASRERFRDTLCPKLFALPHFRSKMELKKGVPRFIELDPRKIDLDYHFPVFEGFEGKEMDEENLNEFLSSLYKQDMDLNKPLWKFHFIPKLADGRSVLVAQIDHCLADGTTCVAILKDIIIDQEEEEEEEGEEKGEEEFKKKKKKKKKEKKPSSIHKRPKPQLGMLSKTSAFFGGAFKALFGIAMPSDPQTTLKVKDHRNPTPAKAVAFSEAVDLDKAKELKDKIPGATLNDVMLAIMTITIRSYLEEKQDPIVSTNKTIRGNFPYDMRKNNVDILKDAFGNNFSTPTFKFPLHFKNGHDLIRQIKRQIELIKVSPEPFLNQRIAQSLSNLNSNTMADLLQDANGKVTAMLSNVRGPEEAVTVGGLTVTDLRFYTFAPIGLYFGILTYNNKLTASVTLDPTCDQVASRLAKHWKPSFEKLYDEISQSN